MKTFIIITILLAICCSAPGKNDGHTASAPLCFIQNVGQVTDGYGHGRGDVQYVLYGDGISVFISAGRIHYQFMHVQGDSTGKQEKNIAACRMDVSLAGADTTAVPVATAVQPYYEEYYTHGLAGSRASAYGRIRYPDIYPGIDWSLYIKDGKVEYEFTIKENADAGKIALEYGGATGLRLNADGSITATTPAGTVREAPPVCYAAGGARVAVASRYVLRGHTLGFAVAQHDGALTIDPTLAWATYYGGMNYGSWASVVCDHAGNVYMAGDQSNLSVINIATTGAYLDTFGRGLRDAYIVKFDSLGRRQWSTYYGGYLSNPMYQLSGDTYALSLVCDGRNNVYMAGLTESDSGIATPGSFQPEIDSPISRSTFLVKFNTAGLRQWATYYNGTTGGASSGLAMDSEGYIYMTGGTTSLTGIATPGAYKSALSGTLTTDAYLVKFDSMGVRQWGTYFGGIYDDVGTAICTDNAGGVYIAGYTESTDSVASAGSCQPVYGGGYTDCFAAKFSNAGVLQWSTYYGGAGTEQASGITARGGKVYICGFTNSTAGIATAGSHQPVYGGGQDDAFLVALNSDGVRQWGTYYGGDSVEYPGNVGQAFVTTDSSGNLYLSGVTSSRSGMSTPYSYQPHYGGGLFDAFIAKFSSGGVRQWGTYYGNCGNDGSYACTTDGLGHLYLAGFASSMAGIATPGSFQPAADSNGWYREPFYAFDPFLAKFNLNEYNGIMGDTSLCDTAGTYSIPAVPDATYTWLLPAGFTGASSTDSITVHAAAGAAGNIQVIVHRGCSDDTAQALHVTVYPPVAVSIMQIGHTLSATTGFAAYQWYLNGSLVSGATGSSYVMMASGNYYVSVTGGHGCSSSSATTAFVDAVSAVSGRGAISIYPNPAGEAFTIDHAAGSELKLYNIWGQEVCTYAITQDRQQVDISRLAKGMYTVQVSGGNWLQVIIK